MRSSRNASLVVVVLCAAVLPALAGVIAGGLSAPEPAPPRGQTLASSSLTLFATPGWRRVTRAPRIPGLDLRDGLALAPAGQEGHVGLVSGRLATGGGPLPRSLLGRLRGDLRTEVVGLGTWDGYRYSGLRLRGFGRSLVLYSVPTGAGAIAVGCYADASSGARLPTCERIARSLDIVDGADAGLPQVSRGYGRSVSAALGRLDAGRRTQRTRLKGAPRPPLASEAAGRLALSYEAAARSLSDVVPPQAASGAHAALVQRLWAGRDAYRRLAAAARDRDVDEWSTARAGVGRAESRVASSLADLGALGYGRRI